MNRQQAIHDITDGVAVHASDEILADFAVSLVNDVYDDFESRTCSNCAVMDCTILSRLFNATEYLNFNLIDFGCNQFERDK